MGRKTRGPARKGLTSALAFLLALGSLGPWSRPAEGFERADAITLEVGEHPASAVVDPAGRFAYFGLSGGQVGKIDLSTFSREGVITAPDVSGPLSSAVMDPDGEFAYFGTGTGTAGGKVVKVDLSTFTVDDVLVLSSAEIFLLSAVMDPAGKFAYFVTDVNTGSRVIRIDLEQFDRDPDDDVLVLDSGDRKLGAAVIDPAGEFAYFAGQGGNSNPTRIVKVDLSTFQRVGSIDYVPNPASDPFYHPGILSAVMDPAGDFAYFGAITTFGDTLGGGRANSRVLKVGLGTFAEVDGKFVPREWDPTSAAMDPAGRFAYFGLSTSFGIPGEVVRIDLDRFDWDSFVQLETDERLLPSAFVGPSGDFAYFAAPSGGSAPSKVVRVDLGPICGDVVTEDVVLIADTGPCPDDGLVIGAPGIDIDLGGHTLLGDGSGGGHGVTLGPGIDADDVTIRNGRIAGFSNGVHLTGGSAATLRNLTAIDNLRHGVVLRTDEAEVRNLTTRRNGGHGLVADSSVRTRVRGSDSRANGGHGLNLDSDSRTVVRNTVAVDNDRHGILARADGRAVLTGNQSNRNDRVGIAVPSNRARIHGNRVVANEGLGIRAPNRPRVTGDNTARRNNQGGRQCRPPRLC